MEVPVTLEVGKQIDYRRVQVQRFDDHLVVPKPAGVALRALARFLRVDGDLLHIAAENSAELDVTGPSCEALARWIGNLDEPEKNSLLLRLASDSGPHRRAGEL